MAYNLSFFHHGLLASHEDLWKFIWNKESILASYQSNASGSRVYTISKARNSEYSDINDALYKWFILARSNNIPVGGPQLFEKAKMIAATLGKPEFKG